MKEFIALAVLLLGFTACSSTPREPDPSWQQGPVQAPSDRVLWKVSLLSLQKMGFPLAGGLDPSSMVAESGWRNHLAPFSGDGFRVMAEVHMDPLGPGEWDVRTRVKKQRNMSIVKPLDARYAEWEWVADDVTAARVLLQHIRTFLEPGIELKERPEDPIEAFIEKAEEIE